jgi:hypothetical protein
MNLLSDSIQSVIDIVMPRRPIRLSNKRVDIGKITRLDLSISPLHVAITVVLISLLPNGHSLTNSLP